ncbi:MAG: hypothetical protein HY259_06415 [Chloroflexi bacterium]|nr:hypothetical protein [Chloroflexota bacterium]
MKGLFAKFIVVGLVVLASLALTSCGLSSESAGDHYQNGLKAAQQGDWDKARQEFDAAKDYQDAAKRALDAQEKAATVSTAYERASTAMNGKDWWSATKQLDIVLNLSPNYKDSIDLRSKAVQELEKVLSDATKKLDAGDLQGAANAYKAAGGYKQADQKATDLANAAGAYDKATKAIGAQDLWLAYSQLGVVLKLVPDFKGATDALTQVQQRLDGFVSDAEGKVTNGDLEAAIAAYKQAGGYKQADQKAAQLNSARAQLDQLYGQMGASAASSQWDVALNISSQILNSYPNYRDVKAKRAGYLEQLYTAASTALSQGNNREAVRLFGILVSAEKNYRDSNEKLGQAQLAARKAAPGVYPVNARINTSAFVDWIVTLTSIEILADGRLKMNLAYQNNSTQSANLRCPSGSANDPAWYIVLSTGIKSFSVDDDCHLHQGETFSVQPGGVRTGWEVYPSLDDATKPFTYVADDWGSVKDIILVR